jgi:ribosome-binding factor A
LSKSKKSFKLNIREKEQSQRQLRVAQLVNISLMECLRKASKLSPSLDGCPLTITKVTVSADLKIANCFFLPFNTKLTSDEILKALEDSKFVIRHYITRQINLKYSPEIRFFYDAGFDNAALIESLLGQ